MQLTVHQTCIDYNEVGTPVDAAPGELGERASFRGGNFMPPTLNIYPLRARLDQRCL